MQIASHNKTELHWRLSLLQSISALFVLITATIAAPHVEWSDGAHLGLTDGIYLALRLFILNTNGLPSGGPFVWRTVMIACFFLGPAIFATVILNIAKNLWDIVARAEHVARRLRNHTIVCGYGKHGRAIAERLFAHNPQLKLVIVDRDMALPSFVEIEPHSAAINKFWNRKQALSVPVIHGDMSEPETLRRAGAMNASCLWAVSSDDALNIHACLMAEDIHGKGPACADFHTHPLVSDIILFQSLQNIKGSSWLINLHKASAASLFASEQWQKLETDKETIVVAGFGKFGKMLTLCHLKPDGAPQVSARRVWVIDKDAEIKVNEFIDLHSINKSQIIAKQMDIRSIKMVIDVINQARQIANTLPTVVLCTDSDSENLHTAFRIAQADAVRPTVVTRIFDPPVLFEKLLEKEAHVIPVVLNRLLAKNLPSCCCPGTEDKQVSRSVTAGPG
jgi:voltage-gated potassium channel Kch